MEKFFLYQISHQSQLVLRQVRDGVSEQFCDGSRVRAISCCASADCADSADFGFNCEAEAGTLGDSWPWWWPPRQVKTTVPFFVRHARAALSPTAKIVAARQAHFCKSSTGLPCSCMFVGRLLVGLPTSDASGLLQLSTCFDVLPGFYR